MAELFDSHANSYSDEVSRSISFIGQDAEFFARSKAHILLKIAGRNLGSLELIEALDVGCGVGLVHPYLAPRLGSLTGTDVSTAALEAAKRANQRVRYEVTPNNRLPFADAEFDLAFAMGVLHHVLPDDRKLFVRETARVVRPHGLLVLFEHNPLNPLTRWAVARCDFDRDANLLCKPRAKRLLRATGLRVVEDRYVMFFPWDVRGFRRLERALGWLPIGAQYYVAARRQAPRPRSSDGIRGRVRSH